MLTGRDWTLFDRTRDDQSSYPDGQWLVGSLDNGDNSNR